MLDREVKQTCKSDHGNRGAEDQHNREYHDGLSIEVPVLKAVLWLSSTLGSFIHDLPFVVCYPWGPPVHHQVWASQHVKRRAETCSLDNEGNEEEAWVWVVQVVEQLLGVEVLLCDHMHHALSWSDWYRRDDEHVDVQVNQGLGVDRLLEVRVGMMFLRGSHVINKDEKDLVYKHDHERREICCNALANNGNIVLHKSFWSLSDVQDINSLHCC